jgi:hypothetical protein
LGEPVGFFMETGGRAKEEGGAEGDEELVRDLDWEAERWTSSRVRDLLETVRMLAGLGGSGGGAPLESERGVLVREAPLVTESWVPFAVGEGEGELEKTGEEGKKLSSKFRVREAEGEEEFSRTE